MLVGCRTKSHPRLSDEQLEEGGHLTRALLTPQSFSRWGFPEFPPTRSSRVSFASCELRFKSSRPAAAGGGRAPACLAHDTRADLGGVGILRGGVRRRVARVPVQMHHEMPWRVVLLRAARPPYRPPAPQSVQADTSPCLSPAPCVTRDFREPRRAVPTARVPHSRRSSA